MNKPNLDQLKAAKVVRALAGSGYTALLPFEADNEQQGMYLWALQRDAQNVNDEQMGHLFTDGMIHWCIQQMASDEAPDLFSVMQDMERERNEARAALVEAHELSATQAETIEGQGATIRAERERHAADQARAVEQIQSIANSRDNIRTLYLQVLDSLTNSIAVTDQLETDNDALRAEVNALKARLWDRAEADRRAAEGE